MTRKAQCGPGTNQILVLDDFIKPDECREILFELEFCFWEPSAVIHRAYGGIETRVRKNFRSSSTADQEWFSARLRSLVSRIERRLRSSLGAQPSLFEPWQATRYGRGERFEYHLDCGFWERSTGGERVATYLLYLDTPRSGGGTHFRALNQIVKARAGRLLVWNNLLADGGCNGAMIHSGLEVKKGHKTTLVTWERQREAERNTKHEEH